MLCFEKWGVHRLVGEIMSSIGKEGDQLYWK